jgi:flagellar biosynthesis/type III secretory pathway chaperone
LSSTGILDLQQVTTQKSAILPTHFTSQDILNEENGITTISDFEDEDPNYDNRQRLRLFY